MRDMKSQEMEVLRRQLDTVESDLKQAERRIRDHSDNAIVPDNSISNDIPALSMSSLEGHQMVRNLDNVSNHLK